MASNQPKEATSQASSVAFKLGVSVVVGVGIAAAMGTTGGTALLVVAGASLLSAVGEEAIIDGATTAGKYVKNHVLPHKAIAEVQEKSPEVAKPERALAEPSKVMEKPLSVSSPDITPSHSSHVAALQSGKGAAITR